MEGEAADARTEWVMAGLVLALVADAHRGSAGSSCLWVQLRYSIANFLRSRLTILPRSSGGGGGGTVDLGAAQSLTLQRDDLGERVVHLANPLFDGLQATVASACSEANGSLPLDSGCLGCTRPAEGALGVCRAATVTRWRLLVRALHLWMSGPVLNFHLGMRRAIEEGEWPLRSEGRQLTFDL